VLLKLLLIDHLSLCNLVRNITRDIWLAQIVAARVDRCLLLAGARVLSTDLAIVHARTDISSSSRHLAIVNRLLISG